MKLFLLLLIQLIVLVGAAPAQFNWEVTHHKVDAEYIYYFGSLDCNGLNCTVGALMREIRDTFGTKFGHPITFFRTIDGGRTWKLQDPKLDFQCCFNDRHIRSVQQIDSLNIVAVGDSGLIVRTFDGGDTWIKQVSNTKKRFSKVHFSDSQNGIVSTIRDTIGTGQILTTSDGGNNWTKVNYNFDIIGEGYLDNHCFGQGKFAVMPFVYGAPIYVTNDNWKSVKRIDVLNSTELAKYYFLVGFHITGENQDTILTYGSYWGPLDTLQFTHNGVIRISTSGGDDWLQTYLAGDMQQMHMVTDFTRDTIIAVAYPGGTDFHISTNRGMTWARDTVIADSLFPSATCWGIDWSGTTLNAIYGAPFISAGTALLRGEAAFSAVSRQSAAKSYPRVYPSPATEVLHIASIEASTPFQIKDLIGRTIVNGMIGGPTGTVVDVSHLPAGVYFVYVDDLHDGHPVLVGKAAIMRR